MSAPEEDLARRHLFSGVWRLASSISPEDGDFMVIDPERGRIIILVVVSKDPIKRTTMRHWYEQVRPGVIQVKLKPDSEWKAHEYVFEGDTLYFTRYEREYPWVANREGQEWMDERLKRAHARMDEEEREAGRGRSV